MTASGTDQAFDLLCGEIRQELLAQRFNVPSSWKDTVRPSQPDTVADLNISRVIEEKDYVRTLGSNRVFLEFPDGYPYGPGMVFRVTTDLFACIDTAMAEKVQQLGEHAVQFLNTIILRLDFVRRGNDLKQVVVEFVDTQVGEAVRRALLVLGYYAYNTAPSQPAHVPEGTLMLRDVTYDAEATTGAIAGAAGGMKNVLSDTKLNMFAAVFGTASENAVLPTGETGSHYLALRKFDFAHSCFHNHAAIGKPEGTVNWQRRLFNEFGILVTALKCDEVKVPGRDRPLQPWEHLSSTAGGGRGGGEVGSGDGVNTTTTAPGSGALAPVGFKAEMDVVMMTKTNAYMTARKQGYLSLRDWQKDHPDQAMGSSGPYHHPHHGGGMGEGGGGEGEYYYHQDGNNMMPGGMMTMMPGGKKKAKKEVDLDDFNFNDEEEEEDDDDHSVPPGHNNYNTGADVFINNTAATSAVAVPLLDIMGDSSTAPTTATNNNNGVVEQQKDVVGMYDDFGLDDVIQDEFTSITTPVPPELGMSLLPAPTVSGGNGGVAAGGILGNLPPANSGLLSAPPILTVTGTTTTTTTPPAGSSHTMNGAGLIQKPYTPTSTSFQHLGGGNAAGILSTQLPPAHHSRGGAGILGGGALLAPPTQQHHQPLSGGPRHQPSVPAALVDPSQLAATAVATVKTLKQLQLFLKTHEKSLMHVQESEHQSQILSVLLANDTPSTTSASGGGGGGDSPAQKQPIDKKSNFILALEVQNVSSGYILNWINCDAVLKGLTANFEKLCTLFPPRPFNLPPMLELCMKKISEPSKSFTFLEKLLCDSGKLLFKLLEDHGGVDSAVATILNGASPKHSLIMNEPDMDNQNILPQQLQFFSCQTLARLVRSDEVGGHETLALLLKNKLLCHKHLYTEITRMMAGEAPPGTVMSVRFLRPFLGYICGKCKAFDELLVEKMNTQGTAGGGGGDVPSLLVALNADLQVTLVKALLSAGVERSGLTMKDFSDLKEKRPTIFARNPQLSQLIAAGPILSVVSTTTAVGSKTQQRPGAGTPQPDDRFSKKQRTEQQSMPVAKSLFRDHPESGVPFPPLNNPHSKVMYTFSMSRSTGFYYFYENTKLSAGGNSKPTPQFNHPLNGKQYCVSPQAFFNDQQGSKSSKIQSLDALASLAGVNFPEALRWSHNQTFRHAEIDAVIIRELGIVYKA